MSLQSIDVWVGFCMFMVFGALIEFTIANWLANKARPKNKTIHLSKCVSKANEALYSGCWDFRSVSGNITVLIERKKGLPKCTQLQRFVLLI